MTFLKEKRSLHYIKAPKALCKHGLYLAKIPNLFSWREIIFDKRCRQFECFAKSEIFIFVTFSLNPTFNSEILFWANQNTDAPEVSSLVHVPFQSWGGFFSIGFLKY